MHAILLVLPKLEFQFNHFIFVHNLLYRGTGKKVGVVEKVSCETHQVAERERVVTAFCGFQLVSERGFLQIRYAVVTFSAVVHHLDGGSVAVGFHTQQVGLGLVQPDPEGVFASYQPLRGARYPLSQHVENLNDRIVLAGHCQREVCDSVEWVRHILGKGEGCPHRVILQPDSRQDEDSVGIVKGVPPILRNIFYHNMM